MLNTRCSHPSRCTKPSPSPIESSEGAAHVDATTRQRDQVEPATTARPRGGRGTGVRDVLLEWVERFLWVVGRPGVLVVHPAR